MRAFIGIALPEQVRASLRELQQELNQAGADVKWVEPEQLHITLKFLDEISEEQQRQVQEALKRITQHTPAFQVGLRELGAFPSLNDPRIMWVGVDEGRSQVVQLAEAIEQDSRALGLKKEDRRYSAHATIGRMRSPRGARDFIERLHTIQWNPPTSWQASSITLYHSVLASDGPTYAVLADLPLK